MGGTLHNDEPEFTLKESRYSLGFRISRFLLHMARRYTKVLKGMLSQLG